MSESAARSEWPSAVDWVDEALATALAATHVPEPQALPENAQPLMSALERLPNLTLPEVGQVITVSSQVESELGEWLARLRAVRERLSRLAPE